MRNNWIIDIMKNIFEFFYDILYIIYKKLPPPENTVIPKKVEPEVALEPVSPTMEKTEVPTPKSPREILYDTSYVLLSPSQDVSPADVASDEYACAESVWNVLNDAFPGNVGFPLTVSTIKLCAELLKSSLYEEVYSHLPGDIIISVTGSGNGVLSSGHTGICGYTHIMNNDSGDGKWKASYSYKAWDDYFHKHGGMRPRYFRRVYP